MRAWIFIAAFVPGLAFAEGAPNPQIDRLWRAKCASCHGPDGKGQTEQGKKMAIGDLSSAEWQSKTTDDQIRTAINDGVKTEKNGVKKEMEAYKSKLRPDQIDGLIAYVRGLKK
jgi:mono/diheme cytochrome c family protein